MIPPPRSRPGGRALLELRRPVPRLLAARGGRLRGVRPPAEALLLLAAAVRRRTSAARSAVDSHAVVHRLSLLLLPDGVPASVEVGHSAHAQVLHAARLVLHAGTGADAGLVLHALSLRPVHQPLQHALLLPLPRPHLTERLRQHSEASQRPSHEVHLVRLPPCGLRRG